MPDPKRPFESFARLYDDILDNAKVVQLQPADFGLYCALMVYSHSQDTDGRVPVLRARGLLAFTDKGFLQSLAVLVAATLVERDGEWLTVHDYLEHNASHAERIAQRNARSDAAKHAANVRWGNAQRNASEMPKVEGRRLKDEFNASSVGSLPDDEPGLELAVAIADVLGVPALAPLEIQACGQALIEFPYLIPSEFVERAKEHQKACLAKNFPIARTVQGLWEAWRSQNDYNADHGRQKPRVGTSSGLTKAFAS